MVRSKGLIFFLLIIVATSIPASAGIMNTSPQYQQNCYCKADSQSAESPIIPVDFIDMDFDLRNDISLPFTTTNIQKEDQVQDQQFLIDGTNSLSLCISALVCFGLIGTTNCLKKIHFGFVPDWYHDGGPLQVGHSYAVAPNCLCNKTANCFIQPDFLLNTSQHQLYRQREIVSLWRKSQFTPESIASRGPPYMS